MPTASTYSTGTPRPALEERPSPGFPGKAWNSQSATMPMVELVRILNSLSFSSIPSAGMAKVLAAPR
jgi:hypothetical protein